MLSRILTNMFFLFIFVNITWFLLCNDASGFLTTVGFDDKLISVLRWIVSGILSVF